MATRLPPKVMAKKLVRMLRPQHPDYHYLKKVFQYTRELLEVRPGSAPQAVARTPNRCRISRLVRDHLAGPAAHARGPAKLLLFTGIRNAELVGLRLTDVDLQTCHLRMTQGKGHKDRHVLFPTSFRGELAQYVERQRPRGHLSV